MNQLNNLEVPAKGHAAKRAALLNGASDLQAAKRKKSSGNKPVKTKAASPKSQATKGAGNPGQPNRPRAKQALLIEMLQSKGGATIDEIVKATDWQPHSARAMISGLRKTGYEIELGRNKDDESVYRIVSTPRRKGK